MIETELVFNGNFKYQTSFFIAPKAFRTADAPVFSGTAGKAFKSSFCPEGYAREGVASLARWALGRGDIRAILATTAKENISSQKVLKAGGWVKTGENAENIFWRLDKKTLERK